MNTATATRPRTRRWLWFWGLLVILAIVAVVVPIVYNLEMQLTPEELAGARARWEASGIKDYDLALQERLDNEEDGTGYHIKVRDGKVVAAECEGEALSEEEARQFTVEALFERMSQTLNEDVTSGQRRNYVSAHFDKKRGFPIRYVHRIRGTKTRVEWNIRLTPQTPP